MDTLVVKPNKDVIITFEGSKRRIGSFHDHVLWHDGTYKDNVFCCSRSSNRHFIKKYYGFGFNYQLIMDSGIEFEYVMMTTDKMKHFLTREEIINTGIFDASIVGFEPQLFVQASLMKRMNREKYEELSNSIKQRLL